MGLRLPPDLERKVLEMSGHAPRTDAEILASLSEKDWQNMVIGLARENGWLVYHTRDSRKSQPGFPDLVMCKGPWLIMVELKTDTGTTTPAQNEWLFRLQEHVDKAGYSITGVWRPCYWPEVQRILKGE